MVVAPDEASRFVVCDAECMRLQHAAYWVSLADAPLVEGPDAPESVTVPVPRHNLVTPSTLRALVAGDADPGERS